MNMTCSSPECADGCVRCSAVHAGALDEPYWCVWDTVGWHNDEVVLLLDLWTGWCGPDADRSLPEEFTFLGTQLLEHGYVA